MTRLGIDPTPAEIALANRLLFEARVAVGSLHVGRADVVRIAAEAFRRGRRMMSAERANVRHCRVCGCDDLAGCHTPPLDEPCHWVEPGLCSACQPFAWAPL